MADQKWVMPVLVILVGVLVLYQTNIGGFKENFFPQATPADGADDGTGDTSGVIEVCDLTGGLTLTVGPMKKLYAPTTTMSGEYARLFLDGSDEGLFADSATKALTPFDEISLIYAENSSTYYANKIDVKLPCKATLSSSQIETDVGGNNIKDAFRLYAQDTTVNLGAKCYNDDDGLLNHGSGGTANESMANQQKVSIRCSIEATSDEAFSPYGGVYLTTIGNTTAYDEIKTSPRSAGWTATKVDTPTFRSNANVTTGRGATTYLHKKSGTAGKDLIGLINGEVYEYTLFLDSGDQSADNPTDGQNGGGGAVYQFYDDADWYRNTDTGIMEFGTENNDDTNQGITASNVNHFVVR